MSKLREDSLPAHDYFSIAVEFDNGRDLTYMWSAALPEGKVFQCPLPWWDNRETHQVVRSDLAKLGLGSTKNSPFSTITNAPSAAICPSASSAYG